MSEVTREEFQALEDRIRELEEQTYRVAGLLKQQAEINNGLQANLLNLSQLLERGLSRDAIKV